MNRSISAACAFFILTCLSFGQSATPRSPCDYSGELLRDRKGAVVMFPSDEMKRRAVHKADVSDFMKRADIKGTVLLDVLVSASGTVTCVRTLVGLPILQAEVEKAIRSWTFEPANADDHPVAYLGHLEFTLCNISCGKEGMHLSILK